MDSISVARILLHCTACANIMDMYYSERSNVHNIVAAVFSSSRFIWYMFLLCLLWNFVQNMETLDNQL